MDVNCYMRRIKNHTILSISSLIFACISLPALATSNQTFTLPDYIEFSAAGGINWLHANNTNLTISPYETDSVNTGQKVDAPLWKLGAGYYAWEENLNTRGFLNHLLLELNLYRTSATLTGNVWQYQLPQFNNYNFHAPITSTRLMLDAKPSLFTYHHLSPYVVIGAGVGWNTMSYQENVTGAGVDPRSFLSLRNHTNTNFAYDLGAGLNADINKQLTLSLEFIYTNLGNAAPSNSSGNLTALTSSPDFSMMSQSILLGISWKN